MSKMSTGELQIAERARNHKGEALHSLHHFIDDALLEESYKQLNKNSSAGVDGENWYEFGILAKERIPELLSKFKAGEYRAPRIRRVYIPKGDGGQRPLGINTIEDKVLQGGVRKVLEPIYEEDFKDFSYGFRPGRSAHQAIALAVTPGGEFVLAAVWDTIRRKGQLAVIAVQGQVLASNQRWETNLGETYLYGFPNWGMMKGLKLLGFVDLPIAAPTAIAAGHNLQWIVSPRMFPTVNKEIVTLLNSQSERNTWYNDSPAVFPDWYKPPAEYYKRTASAGYAMVASRAEDKVIFVDLQPLFSYYREMYFTTQERYDQTKDTGDAANQWPYTFDHAPKQMPVVTHTLSVKAPTALAAGLSPGMAGEKRGLYIGRWRASAFNDQHAYVTATDGRLLIYNVGGLNTESAATPPVLVKTVPIGKNPTSIDFGGNAAWPHNDMVIACRGDNAVYCLTSAGDIQYVLRDSRIKDAVMAERSYIARNIIGSRQIHVVDFAGKTVLTYSVAGQRGWITTEDFFAKPMKFGAYSAPIPGYPFMFQQEEVP
jgi:hypothetical protein